MKPTKKFLSRLRARIWETGLHQYQIAKVAGITEFRLSRFLCGHSELTEHEIQRVQDALEQK